MKHTHNTTTLKSLTDTFKKAVMRDRLRAGDFISTPMSDEIQIDGRTLHVLR